MQETTDPHHVRLFPIRRDLRDVSKELERLQIYAIEAQKFNHDDWSRLKNREDFEKIYDSERVAVEARDAWEWLYSTGRDCAIWMSSHLEAFERVADFPTLTSYVRSFEDTWITIEQVEKLKKGIERAKSFEKKASMPWAVSRMIDLFERQIGLLEGTRGVVGALRHSDLYKRENGDLMSNKNSDGRNTIVVQGSVQQLIGSVENSQLTSNLNWNIAPGDFSSLEAGLKEIKVGAEDIGLLREAIGRDPKPSSAESFGPSVSEWIGRMVQKSAAGLWNFSLKVGAAVLARYLAAYYKLDDR